MVYNGYILCGSTDTAVCAGLYPSFFHPRVKLQISSFEAFSAKPAGNDNENIDIIVAELSPEDPSESWFPLLLELIKNRPYLRIIFVLSGNITHDFYCLNQIPFSYLIPASQAELLLRTGLDKAVEELDRCSSVRHFKKTGISAEFFSAVFFSTDNLIGKGSHGCHVHYPDGRTEYTRHSLKNILSELPANFIQIHKSYVLNMNYFGKQLRRSRASGKLRDEYVQLSHSGYPEAFLIPVGPKYRRNILDYILNKYSYPFLADEHGKEVSENED